MAERARQNFFLDLSRRRFPAFAGSGANHRARCAHERSQRRAIPSRAIRDDFSAASRAAAPYALSLAQENGARVLLVHVMRKPYVPDNNEETRFQLSVAEAIQQLYDTVPKDTKLSLPPEVAVEYGEPAERILTVARERRADLIVLGLRDATGRIGAATHLERATAHKVVAHSTCPVLTVREETTADKI